MERITIESEALAQDGTTEAIEFVPSVCLFCKFDSKSLDLNVAHMQKKHGLFIADQEYLVDLETFIGYLFTVISQFHECFYCGSCKGSAQAARSHMVSKGHCNLKPEPGSEYEDFYEVTSDNEDEDLDTGAKEGKSPEILVPDEHELHLPSGRILGHRSQARYYRQRTPARGTSTEIKAIEDSKETSDNQEPSEPSRNTSRQLTTRMRGEMGMIGVSEFQKRALIAVEKKMLKAEQRAKSDYRAGLERLGNKQKYFRVSTDCVFDLTK
jgi:pre-60S factor REI1